MQSIFDDELRETGQFWPNPSRTRPLSPLSIVADGLEVARTTAPSAACQRQKGPRRHRNPDPQQARP